MGLFKGTKRISGDSRVNLVGQASSSNNYSMEEKVVGTWIDGKPLYQKTVFATITTTVKNIPFNIPGVDINGVKNIFGYIKTTSGNITPCPYYSEAQVFSSAWYESSTKSIKVTTGNFGLFGDYTLTVQYTKNTD